MTIQWGAYDAVGGEGLRVGIQDEGHSTVTNASTTFVVSFTAWTNPGPSTGASFDDNQHLALATDKGALNSSSNDYHNSQVGSGSIVQRGGTFTVTYTYGSTEYGTSPGTIHITADISGVFNGVTPTQTIAVAIPARPWANPAATTSASTSRVSDSQASVSWTNHDATAAAYGSLKVYRQVDGAAYALRATLGVVASYSDTGLAVNHKYRFRPNVLGKNGHETTGAESGDIWTTPGAPTGCTATKQPNGDVIIAWTNNVNYTEYTTRVEESTDGGSSWSEITSKTAGVTSHTATAPSTATTHTYRVRARSTTGSLNSGYATSNTVTLLSTANPPSGLSPAGVAIDAAGDITLTWTHNPADGTPQSKYQLQYKVDAGSYTTVGPTTSGTSSYTITGGTLANGHTITWHVKTAGANSTLSSYSSDSTFTTSTAPTVAISTPGSTFTESSLTAEWVYFQAESSAEAGWQAFLLDADGNQLEAQSGTTGTSITFATALADATDYTVRVIVTSAAGLDSDPAEQDFTVSYLPPAGVTVTAEYSDLKGWIAVTVTGDAPVDGVTEAIATVALQRSLDGGTTWVTVASGVVLADDGTANITDTTPKVRGTNTYRAVATSALPSSVTSDTVDLDPQEPTWGYLSMGDGFTTVARARAMPSYAAAAGRDKQLYHFAGRAKPVELAGEATNFALTVNVKLTADSATAEDVEAIALTAGIVCWRGPDGRRIFGSLSGVATGRTFTRTLDTVQLTVTEVDYTE